MSKLIYILLLIIFYSCNQNKKKSDLNGFDISPDVRSIVFSYKKDSLYNIYTQLIKDGKPTAILKNSGGNYINPKYINKGKTIVALYYSQNELLPEFHFYNVITNKITDKIKVHTGFIADYTFSSNKIFYLQARTFQSYSPITPKAYHDYDVYELDLVSQKSKRLSNFNSYSMQEILNIGQDSLLISQQGEANESGLFLFKTESEKRINRLSNKIMIKNDTLRNSTMYSNPILLSNNNILCSSSYQIVLLDLKAKKEYPILPSTGYHYSIIRNVRDIIFYQQKDNTNNIYYFNLNDKKIKTINIIDDNFGL